MKNCLGLATCFYPDSSPERWETAAKAGFTDAEIDTNNRLPAEEICRDSEKIFADLKAGGLPPAPSHLPFGPAWDISAADAGVRVRALEGLESLLQWAGNKGIGTAVLHPSFEPIDNAERADRLAFASESIRRLGEAAANCGVRIAVENLPRTCLGNCSGELAELTGNGMYAGVCFDVNHLLLESHENFVRKAGHLICTTHLSDYDRKDEKHWFPGDGCIDWAELRALMEGAGYTGRYLFELGENASPSLGRPFTPRELAEKFCALTGLPLPSGN